MRLGAVRESPGLAAAFLSVRHLVMPVFAIFLTRLADLPLAQQNVVVAFAALPTASSAYVLAIRMGGHGAFVASLVSLSTLLGMAGLPLTLAAWNYLSRTT